MIEAPPNKEITLFCPIRLNAGGKTLDGFMEEAGSEDGRFTVLVDDEGWEPGEKEAFLDGLEFRTKVEITLGGGGKVRFPCRIRELAFDDDGLFLYLRLGFLALEGEARTRLREFLNTLW